jgi:hypothetical protein
MKKILYLFLTVSLIFSSCKKEEDEVVTPTVISGCTDSDATNYIANATSDDGTCIYKVTEAVWSITSQTLNGINMQDADILYYQYLWDDGSYGWEEWSISTGDPFDYGGGPGVGLFTSPAQNVLTLYDGEDNLTVTIDIMTDNNNMTWRASGPGGDFVAELVRTSRSLNLWK